MPLDTFALSLVCSEMQKRSEMGGFEFMPRPSDAYYRKLPEKVGPIILHPS